MPAGPGPVGFVAFTGVKLVGYTVAALALKEAFKSPSTSVIKAGLARTGIGLVVGGIYGGIWVLLVSHYSANASADAVAPYLFFALLIPVRIGEWCLLIHFFFDRGLTRRGRDLKFAALGTGWSFVLDAIGIGAAFVVPGGFWIC
jgi:hypothetical protein